MEYKGFKVIKPYKDRSYNRPKFQCRHFTRCYELKPLPLRFKSFCDSKMKIWDFVILLHRSEGFVVLIHRSEDFVAFRSHDLRFCDFVVSRSLDFVVFRSQDLKILWFKYTDLKILCLRLWDFVPFNFRDFV